MTPGRRPTAGLRLKWISDSTMSISLSNALRRPLARRRPHRRLRNYVKGSVKSLRRQVMLMKKLTRIRFSECLSLLLILIMLSSL